MNYIRSYIPGGTFFFTLVTYNRTPIFAKTENISLLRSALINVKSEMPFNIEGAVILPDHIHFLWVLPSDDSNYSKRIGRLKVFFTHALRGENNLSKNVSESRIKQRESDVWQRRFWEHTISDEKDFAQHLDYIHYNPVKHDLVSCPHLWEYSSFNTWVKRGGYLKDWCCICNDKQSQPPDFKQIAEKIGE